jgi:hypothetical protein
MRANRIQIVDFRETYGSGFQLQMMVIFHDYPIPKNTTPAEELKLLADRFAARQEAKVTNSRSGIPLRRKLNRFEGFFFRFAFFCWRRRTA